MEEIIPQVLNKAISTPPEAALAQSRARFQEWFAQTAPLIQWDVIESPLGPLYFATTDLGLCNLDFGISQETFLSRLDPLARVRQNRLALAPFAQQLQEYFAGDRSAFDVPLDLHRQSPFRQSVLKTARSIPAGTVWTYGQVALALGKPKASRAVGQALGHNPVPIIIPCHRVVASNGNLGGYSGGGGLKSKKLLLSLEGAL
ncbi:MAG: methylated-DNA--[protein]-cysteine S-methyltransferase [Chloroflexi bacterium]|nr:methylated-DNA--[protein]-cysteine S-methyltransferase [Chloroflexota bacterium]